MVEKIYFQSSMPRSGSTIFQNLMGQNPEFYVTPTSGMLELVFGARANYTNSPEFNSFIAGQDKESRSCLEMATHNGRGGDMG